jgi:hypothetical protein
MIVTLRLGKILGSFFNLAHDKMPLIGEDRCLFSSQVPQRDLTRPARGFESARLERQPPKMKSFKAMRVRARPDPGAPRNVQESPSRGYRVFA